MRAALGRRLRAIASFLRWRPRFGAFALGSVLESPLLLTNPGHVEIGRGVHIRAGSRIEALDTDGGPARIVIGDGTSIHLHFHCGAALRVEIGKNVLIAGGVYVTDHDHAFDDPSRPVIANEAVLAAPTILEDECWLGEGAKVLKGVRVGRGSIVAAGAIVTRDVPAYTIVAGIPARPIQRWDARASAWVPVPNGHPRR